MSCFTISRSIAKYVLLSLLCYDFTFLAPTESVQESEDYKEEDRYIEDNGENDLLRLDIFQLNTRKPYKWEDWTMGKWEDWTIPTIDYRKFDDNRDSSVIVLYVFVPVFIITFIITFFYICIQNIRRCTRNDNCSSFGPDQHAPLSADLLRPPEPRIDLIAQVHMPPTTSYMNGNLNRDLLYEPARPSLFNELDSNHAAADARGMTISIINSTAAHSSQGRREPDEDKPPDYYTTIMNDYFNPTRPTVSVVNKGKVTPHPE